MSASTTSSTLVGRELRNRLGDGMRVLFGWVWYESRELFALGAR